MTALDRIFAIGRSIWDQRSDLHAEHVSPEALGYWVWLMSEGIAEYPNLRALVPMPPRKLIARVVGDSTDEFFQRSGLNEARVIFTCLAEAGFDPANGGAMLDFGCGCARILRFMARFGDSVELHGCDVDSAAIDWCRSELDYARFEVLPGRPPSVYADGQFEAVYAYSVFTHLSEPLHRAWLEELHRITRPGAALVLTTAGRHVVSEMIAGHEQLTMPSPDELRAVEAELERGGYAFFPFESYFEECPQETAPETGMTFFYPEYVRARWSDLFEVVKIHVSPSKWQDYVVLRRR